MPDGLSEEDIVELEAAEGRAFQISFYNEVLGSTMKGKKNCA